MFHVPTAVDLRLRLPRLFLGLTLCGLGLAAMVRAELGLGPWEVLHQGISRRTGIPIGTSGILVGFAVLLGWLPLRQRLGVGTISNVIWIGLVIDGTLAVMPALHGTAVRVTALLLGVSLVGLGSGFYIGAGLGAGPRDGLMTGLSGRSGRSIRSVRTAMELIALVLGWALGGTVGIGTVVFALGIGFLVQLWLGRLTIPLLTAPAE